MIGLLLVTHGHLADEFVEALEHVVGHQKQVATICIGANDDLEQRSKDIREAVRDVDSGQGVIILTDMFGGTPSNLALKLLSPGQVDVLAGVNLPMLIKLAEARMSCTLDEAANLALDAAQKYMALASQILCKRG